MNHSVQLSMLEQLRGQTKVILSLMNEYSCITFLLKIFGMELNGMIHHEANMMVRIKENDIFKQSSKTKKMNNRFNSYNLYLIDIQQADLL